MKKVQLSTTIFVLITCMASLLPYLIPYEWEYSFDPKKQEYIPTYTVEVLASLLWVIPLFVTLIVGRWNRKLFWLFALFPIAFGPWLFLLYFALSYRTHGFAP